MRRPLFSLCTILFAAATAHALHFYLDANEKRCFIEELPTDTVVEGVCQSSAERDAILNFVDVLSV